MLTSCQFSYNPQREYNRFQLLSQNVMSASFVGFSHARSHISRERCTVLCFVEYSPPTSNLVIKMVFVKDLAQKSRFNDCFRYLQLRNRRPNYGHIRHQRLQIYKNKRFVFEFAQIFVLTGFPFFFWRPFWLEDISRNRWFAIPYTAFS